MKTPPHPLVQRVAASLAQHRLLEGNPLVVGVSGGPDSVCLLHILATLQGPLALKLHAAHLDHQLRGAESEEDAAYVAALCQQLAVPLTSERGDVAGYRARRRLSLEEAARHVRYGFFAAVAASVQAQAVLLGHTAGDQVETILMHILRGSGLAGLRGMEPVSRWHGPGRPTLVIVRPLLQTRRRETQAYCAEKGLDPRSDSSNRSMEPLRNRVRQELLPLLHRLNPGVDRALLRLGASSGQAVELLDAETGKVWRRLARRKAGALHLDRSRLAALPPALLAHALRKAVLEVRGDLHGIRSLHIQQMLSIALGPAGRSVDLPSGLTFSSGYASCRLGSRDGDSPPLPPLEGEARLRVPGTTELPGWRVRARLLSVESLPLPSKPHVAFMDVAVAGRELWVRGRRPGDRVRPLGMKLPKKLQDFLVDTKVPRAWRDRVPLLCNSQQILWVVGYRIGEEARVRPDSEGVLRLEFSRRP